MGPHNACSHADLAMTTIDYKILDTNTRPNDITFPPDWSRFRDDVLALGLQVYQVYLNLRNGLIPSVTASNLQLNTVKFNLKF